MDQGSGDPGSPTPPDDVPEVGEPDPGPPPPCPADMVFVADGQFCIDRFEAPNAVGELPLVMFHFLEAESWCEARSKRLCFDDEWTQACAGPEGLSYPYGNEHVSGTCNDDKLWKPYSQPKLNGWPWKVGGVDEVETLESYLELVSALGTGAASAADHVLSIYQATPGGDKTGCGGAYGVFDLQGNVEEWTRRADGGKKDFHGNLKGRYWAEVRTCQAGVKTHGDSFRFYEIGFRCCSEALLP